MVIDGLGVGKMRITPRARIRPATVQVVIAVAGEGAVRPRLDLIVLIPQNDGDER